MTPSQDFLDRNPELKAQLSVSKVKITRNHPENDFQDMVIESMRLLYWKILHVRPVRIQRKDGTIYYETPIQGDGAGCVDIIGIRDRVIWLELKSDKGVVSLKQKLFIGWLENAGQEVHVIRPKDWDKLMEILE